MDETAQRQEEPDEQAITPDEVWERLSPDLQERVKTLLARMAYKYTLSQRELLPKGTEMRDEVHGHES